jgi:hypothetical protein
METKSIAKINNVSIIVIENGQKLVPIRPICEALGIDHKNQRTKIQEDDFLGSVGVLSTSTGNDGKQYEMFCIPFMFVFGWLFTINPKNVKPEAQEAVSRYRLECYKALFKHFTDQSEFLSQKQLALEKQVERAERIRSDFRNTKLKLDAARRALNQVKELTYEVWQANDCQISIDWPEMLEEN